MDMSILSLSSLANQITTGSELGTAVLGMALDDYDAMSAGMKKMMELSVNPEIGSNIDISV